MPQDLREALIREITSAPNLESDKLVWFSLEYSKDAASGRVFVSRKSAFSDKANLDVDDKEMLLVENETGC